MLVSKIPSVLRNRMKDRLWKFWIRFQMRNFESEGFILVRDFPFGSWELFSPTCDFLNRQYAQSNQTCVGEVRASCSFLFERCAVCHSESTTHSIRITLSLGLHPI